MENNDKNDFKILVSINNKLVNDRVWKNFPLARSEKIIGARNIIII